VSDLELLAYLLPIVLASLTLHELAHAWVAYRLGDPTAKEQGRLTLNPIVHIDPIGTLTFVVTYLLAGLPFGWARPVPVEPRNFKRPLEGMALVAVAGPVTNFLLALGCLAVFRHGGFSGAVLDALEIGYTVNVVLGIFNLLPIPPLDGSRIVGVVMNDATYRRWIALDQIGMFVVFGLFFLFRDEFAELLSSAFDHVTTVMDTIVRA
jgi:Zn-dependent protease